MQPWTIKKNGAHSRSAKFDIKKLLVINQFMITVFEGILKYDWVISFSQAVFTVWLV